MRDMVLRIEKLSQFGRRKKSASPSISQERESTLGELGGYLRQTRLQQSLSLEEIGIKTMIPVRILKAIEEGRMDRLPEPVYIQAFLRRYADALGFNGAEFSSSFPTNIGTADIPKESIWSGLHFTHLQPVHLYLLYIGLIVFAVSSLSARFNSAPQPIKTQLSAPSSPASSDVSPAAISPQTTDPMTQKMNGKVASTAQPNNIKGLEAKVSLKAESWLQVTADGNPVYEGVLPAGTEKNWHAKKTLEISAGNAGGVWVAINGEPPKPVGGDGEVQSATYNAPNAPVDAPAKDDSIQTP